MSEILQSQRLCPEELFSQGVRAGEFIFLAQDARGPDGSLLDPGDAGKQASRTLANLSALLETAGQGLEHLVSLAVYLPDYRDAQAVRNVLDGIFPLAGGNYPATTFLGVMALEGGCRVRMDAVATSCADRQQINCPGVPYARGARCHGVRANDFLFLSGLDASDAQEGTVASAGMEGQTREVLERVDAILRSQNLSLRNVFRTFMFMLDSRVRPGYGKARRERYRGIFAEDEFPPNSGIMMKDLGEDILLRCVALAYRGKEKRLISSPKVRLSPGSFSQSVRVGEWLFVAGQDAIGLDREVRALDDVAGQTEISLGYLRDILEASGATMDDVVKTTVYLVAGQERSRFAKAYRDFFRTHGKTSALPSGLTMEVKELAPSCLVEIDAVARLGG